MIQVTKLPTLILFNGPPRVGKDLATACLLSHIAKFGKSSCQLEFKKFLRQMAIDFSELTPEQANAIEFGGNKDAPHHNIPKGRSWRQWLIHISENVIKPIFGSRAFGDLMLRDINLHYLPMDYIVISDCGFTEEVKVLVEAGFPTCIVRLHRDGHTFQNDSRGYIYIEGVHSIDMHNNGSKAELKDVVEAMFNARSVYEDSRGSP